MRELTHLGALLAVFALAIMTFSSCGRDEAGPGSDSIGRDTPLNLVEAYSRALEERSLEDYDCCLDTYYRYVFLKRDYVAAGVAADAPYWGKTEDLEATYRMLGSSEVMSISCDLPVQEQTDYSDTLSILVCSVDVSVVMSGDPEPTTFWASGSTLRVTVSRDPLNTPLWVIREIEEEIGGGLLGLCAAGPRSATEPETFGSIKAMFK